jgi:hypothetical protein
MRSFPLGIVAKVIFVKVPRVIQNASPFNPECPLTDTVIVYLPGGRSVN